MDVRTDSTRGVNHVDWNFGPHKMILQITRLALRLQLRSVFFLM
jgi:hypothetical protein